MTFAAVMLTPDTAAAIHARFRAVTGLRGELKGSRISLTERAYLLELFDRAGGRAWVAVAEGAKLGQGKGGVPPTDLELYAALLDSAIGHWLPETGGVCTDVVIDDGRYDPTVLARVRDTIQAGLAGWGRASLADSRRSEEHTSELQSLMRSSYAVVCLKKKTRHTTDTPPLSEMVLQSSSR